MAGKQDIKRNATEAPPSIILIKPDGHFYFAPLANNLSDGHVKIIDGKPVVRPASAAKGFKTLDEGADSPAQAAMLRRYFEIEKEAKGAVQPIPEKYLPKICIERRKAAAEAIAVDFDKLLAEARGGEPDEQQADDDAPARGRSRSKVQA